MCAFATNKGWVKKNRCVTFIVEALGGVAPHALAYLRTLAQRAKGKGARDRTRYSKARSGTKSFLTHHLRRVSKAAVVHDAMAIRKQITCLKQQAFGCVAYAAGAGEVEA